MAQSKVQRRGYNAYLRKAKRKFGITHTQARKMYRLQREHAGEPINSRSIDRHPRLAKRFATAAAKPQRKKVSKRAVSRKEPVRVATGIGGERPKPAVKRARTIREWELWWELADSYEDIVVEAGVDTGRSKKK
jgi:hypothetical protein